MAVASVEENVKLKDLWQAKYTVAMLKSMKTVTFETPSGNHAYTVVMVVYSTQGVCVCVCEAPPGFVRMASLYFMELRQGLRGNF